jgi:predicted glycosyltransferase
MIVNSTRVVSASPKRKIWIDLDNSPHVPFFVPIIQELKNREYEVLLTSRDNAQVLELLAYYKLDCGHYGHHYGKYKPIKVLGLGLRMLQLAPLILRESPDLALSHGSRSQIVLSGLLRIPSIAIFDYEHTTMFAGSLGPKWLMTPEIVAGAMRNPKHARLLKYPGIKEDVYVPGFHPIPGIREELGVADNQLMVTIRPPASDAHYHNPASDELFRLTVDYLSNRDNVRMIVLPRNKRQEDLLRHTWSHLFTSGKLRIPSHVVDGLNLIWFSDLVISGGGTMNREAAALGVPVYSIFRGKSGAVDRYLSANGRMVLLETPEDLKLIDLTRRVPGSIENLRSRPALSRIVQNVIDTLEIECHPK